MEGFKILPTTEPRRFRKDVVSSKQINIQFQRLLTGIGVWSFWAKGHNEPHTFLTLCCSVAALTQPIYPVLCDVWAFRCDIGVVFLETMWEGIIPCSLFSGMLPLDLSHTKGRTWVIFKNLVLVRMLMTRSGDKFLHPSPKKSRIRLWSTTSIWKTA